ncbi:hypothetical protein [Jidongwangia harbinensis]|uniref:hypothetical protein n=1 Tax=Jidongwangia harbinensis TaxID=2878561 RepID=UPI001CD9DDC3|nr:hypothetical protein [Jidongwangia harbinensis]MCA2216440.1 hypothetical protein [Jidongwangia harbinensis]
MGPIRRSSAVLAASTVATAVLLPAAATAAPPVGTGHLVQLDSLGGQGSYAVDMNERGDLTGQSGDTTGASRAVVWRHGERSPTALGVDRARPVSISGNGHIAGHVDRALFRWRAGAATYLRRSAVASFHDPLINDRGQVASAAVDQNGTSRAFVWDGERMTMLPTPAGMNSTVADINDRGQVVGALIAPGGSTEHAVLWQQGRMIRLGTLGGAGSTPKAINQRGQVIGNSTIAGSSTEHPFLWQHGRMTDLLAGTDATTARVVAINAAGMMTGSASFGDPHSRPVLWRDGQMIDIGLPGHAGIGTDINDHGDVSGPTWPNPQEGSAVPFRWRTGHTTLFPEPAGDIDMAVLGIDPHGDIAMNQETSRAGNIVLRSV